jgi:porphobilinogen synthase
MMSFPNNRFRRLRTNLSIRALVAENQLSVNDFLAPVFVVEGNNIKEPINSMPGYSRYSLDTLQQEIKELWQLGIKGVLLFVKVADHLKDNEGNEALNENGLMQQAIKTIKNIQPEILVFTDVALDPYSIHGHDGIVEGQEIVNDKTNLILANMAVSHARAGADFVAPSDMMDGRVKIIREALENANFHQTGIMAYSAKYASSFYGPFRDALDSAPGFGDKKTYQMDFANRIEAVKEDLADVEEGADIVMVKPGLAYLDIVREVKNAVNVPVAVYNVSAEYSMLKAAAEKGWINHDAAMMEMLMSFKRAGASIIATYFAKEAATLLHK